MTLNGRMTVTAAVAVVLTTTALYPIFTDSLFFVESVGAILVVAAIGALTRLRSVPVLACLGASLIGLVLYLSWRYAERAGLLRENVTREKQCAMERRILVAQGLYAFGACLCPS